MEGAFISGFIGGATTVYVRRSKKGNLIDAIMEQMILPWVFLFSAVPIFVIGFGIKIFGPELIKQNLIYDFGFGVVGGVVMNTILQ